MGSGARVRVHRCHCCYCCCCYCCCIADVIAAVIAVVIAAVAVVVNNVVNVDVVVVITDSMSVLPPARINVSQLTVYYGQPGHIDLSRRKHKVQSSPSLLPC